MTLILSCITPDYAILVADRRNMALEKYAIVEDDRSKIVLYCQQVAFAYTGLAEIEGLKTDHWLLDKLMPIREIPQMPLAAVCAKIAYHATQAFQKPPLSLFPRPFLRHAFIGVGWFPGTRLKPVSFLVSISNALNDEGEWLAEAKDTFTVNLHSTGSELPFELCAAGELNKRKRIELMRLLRKCVCKGTGPKPIADTFAATIREKAAANPRVGSALLLASIPKGVIAREGISSIGTTFTRDKVMFGSAAANTIEFVYYAPRKVANQP